MILNTELKNIREKMGLTQSDIAQQCGITIRAYQYIELNRRIPRADTAIAIADVLRIKSYKRFKTLFGDSHIFREED